MNYLIDRIQDFDKIKHIIATKDSEYVEYITINPNMITPDTISIVMTTHNRTKQNYFTLDTFMASKFKDVQIIIVEDSTTDFLDIEKLRKYPFQIDLVKIKKKFWLNACVNYNIGFSLILGSKVIIQNSEVCHIGDIISFVHNNLSENQYIAFDVLNLPDFEENDWLYSCEPRDITLLYKYYERIYSKNKQKYWMWYQHANNYDSMNRQFHFLTAITKKDFDRLGGFDLDFSFASCYDDDELIYRVRHLLKLNTISVGHESAQIFGIHQHHLPTIQMNTVGNNKYLFESKMRYFNNFKVWLKIIDVNNLEKLNLIKGLII